MAKAVKKCKVCDNIDEVPDLEGADSFVMYMYRSNEGEATIVSRCSAEDGVHLFFVPIKFCPECGRDLELGKKALKKFKKKRRKHKESAL